MVDTIEADRPIIASDHNRSRREPMNCRRLLEKGALELLDTSSSRLHSVFDQFCRRIYRKRTGEQ